MPSSEVFPKFKAGQLRSSGGKLVKDRKQAVAIFLSERKKEKANGGTYPETRKPPRNPFFGA